MAGLLACERHSPILHETFLTRPTGATAGILPERNKGLKLSKSRFLVIAIVLFGTSLYSGPAGAHNNSSGTNWFHFQGYRSASTGGGWGGSQTWDWVEAHSGLHHYAFEAWVSDTVVDGQCIELWVDWNTDPNQPHQHRNPSMFRRCSTGGTGYHARTDAWTQIPNFVIGWDISVCRVNYSGTLKTRTDCRNENGVNTGWPQNVGAYQNVSDSTMSSQVYIHGLN